jgi:hypothetical protein
VLKELRTRTFLPWNEKAWDTLHVAHDDPPDQRFHGSLTPGFADAYDISAALPFVKDGEILPHHQE